MDQLYPTSALNSYTLYQHVKYMNLVSLSVLICEYFNTLQLEVDLIWRSKWNFGNTIYVISRALPFFDVPLVIYYRLYPSVPTLSNSLCDVLYKIETWSTVFGIIASEVILIMMTYALSKYNRFILWWLIVQVLVCSVAGCAMWGILLRSLEFGEPLLPLPTGCFVVGGKYIYAGIGFIILALNEFILMVIVLGVGVSRYRHSNSTLVRTLYRDGIFYYVFLFMVSMGELVVIIAGPPEYADLLTTFQRVTHSILAARVMLNARNSLINELNNSRHGGVSTAMKFGASTTSKQSGQTQSTSRSGVTNESFQLQATASSNHDPSLRD